jgi:hypothetical protein
MPVIELKRMLPLRVRMELLRQRLVIQLASMAADELRRMEAELRGMEAELLAHVAA